MQIFVFIAHNYDNIFIFTGGEASIHLKTLCKDPALSHIPLVGVAMPLDENEKIKREKLLKSQAKPKTSDGIS